VVETATLLQCSGMLHDDRDDDDDEKTNLGQLSLRPPVDWAGYVPTLYTVSQKKTSHFNFHHNFAIC